MIETSGGDAVSPKLCVAIETVAAADWLPLVPVIVMETGFVLGTPLAPLRSVTVTVVVWPGVMDDGLNEHVTLDEQANVMLPVKEDSKLALATVTVAEVAPTAGVVDGPVAVSEKSATAAPDIVAVGAVPLTLDVTLRDPVLLAVELEDVVSVTVGANVTFSVQLFPGSSVVTQLSVSVNDPDIATAVIVSAAVPLLVRVIGWAALVVPTIWLPNVSDEGLKVIAGAGVEPVPESATL